MLINEVDAYTPNSDTEEFIELYDGGIGNTDLSGLVIVLYSGYGGAITYNSFDLDGQTTNANGYFVIGNAAATNVNMVIPDRSLQNSNAGVALYTGDDVDFPKYSPLTTAGLIDAVVYSDGTSLELDLLPLLESREPKINENWGYNSQINSIQRLPNGSGGARRTLTYGPRTPTPGTENIRNTIEVCASGCNFSTIQEAIDNASFRDLIEVYPGTYTENLTFNAMSLTLHSVGGPGSTTIDGGASGSVIDLTGETDSVSSFLGTGVSAILDGFTLTNGSGSPYFLAFAGGGIYCEGYTLTMRNSILTGNNAPKNQSMGYPCGGALYSFACNIAIEDTIISSNSSEYQGGGICTETGTYLTVSDSDFTNNSSAYQGGALYMYDGDITLSRTLVDVNSSGNGGGFYFSGSNLHIEDSTISGNVAQSDGGGGTITDVSDGTVIENTTIIDNDTSYDGGGLYLAGSGSHVISGCTVSGNTSGSDGGGISAKGDVQVSDSVISGNTAFDRGGGLFCELLGSSVGIHRSDISGNVLTTYNGDGAGLYFGWKCEASVISSVVSGNRFSGAGTGHGAGIYYGGETLTVANSTVSGNFSTGSGGGMLCDNPSTPSEVVNSIFWGNEEEDFIQGVIPNQFSCQGSGLNVAYSNVEGGDPDNPGQPWPGTGNIDADPLFVNPRPASEAPTAAGDYHIWPGSPCIDAGTDDTATYPDLPGDDFEGDPRPMGLGYDMGVDERPVRDDWNSDGSPDILWRNYVTGDNYVWFMDGVTKTGGAFIPRVIDTIWEIAGTADFNGDGQADILWRNYATGENYIWYMNGTTRIGGHFVNKVPDANWRIDGVADFDGDGDPDILWRNYTPDAGDNYIWYMDDWQRAGGHFVNKVPDTNWAIDGVADFNGDSKPDILWRNYTPGAGDNYIWYMNGWEKTGGHYVNKVPDVNWEAASLGDFNGDGSPDILWRSYSTGDDYVWYLNGWQKIGGAPVSKIPDCSWAIEE